MPEGIVVEAPLTRIRVLDFGQAAVGPVAAEYLGWLGADVIKVESPRGDAVRTTRPRLRGMGHTFVGNNLNKRGIVLDLKDPAEREIAIRLIRTADILVENFRTPQVMESFGLGYEQLVRINPRLIYLQSSAYGPRGPMSGMISNEWFSQAAAGLTSVTGQPGGKPEFSRGTATLDWNGAFTNLQGLLVALYVRERTGRGMRIQTSQLQSSIVGATTRIAEYFATGQAPRPMGSARPNIVPDQAFATSDGAITVTVPHDGFWPRLCEALERPELSDDARFTKGAQRVANREVLIPILEGLFRECSTGEWLERLRKADVPVGVPQPRAGTLSSNLLDHPQVQAEDLMTVFDTPNGKIATTQPFWRFDKTGGRITRPSPAHGEHQEEVLRELEEIEQRTWAATTEGPNATRRPVGRQALEGLRVIDASQGVSGPFCAMQLGDLGADVIKVEPPGGDWLRTVGPFQGEESALFLQLNRNKRGIVADLKTAEGRAVLDALLATADVLIEGYRPGVMERLGYGYETLSKRYPQLIYCSISGYGKSGPLARAPATELDVQMLVGSHRHLGTPDTLPLRFGFDFASTSAGMAGFQGIMTALLWREQTGLGQHVETSVLASYVAIHHWSFSAEYSQDAWEGRALLGLTNPPDHGFVSADCPVLITFQGNEQRWIDFLIAIGRPEIMADPRFSDPSMFPDHLAQLSPLINDTLVQWQYEDLRRLVQDELHGTIVRMHDLDSLLHDAHIEALGMVEQIDGHATLGTIPTLNIPWTFDQDLAALRLPPPVLGQHTDEVLEELGLHQGQLS